MPLSPEILVSNGADVLIRVFPGRLVLVWHDCKMDSEDKRLLEASASGQTDRVLQLIEEHGQQLHKYKDQVSEKEKPFDYLSLKLS